LITQPAPPRRALAALETMDNPAILGEYGRVIAAAHWGDAVTVRKDAAPAAGQAAISNVAAMMSFSGGGGLIYTTSGSRQQRALRLHRRG